MPVRTLLEPLENFKEASVGSGRVNTLVIISVMVKAMFGRRMRIFATPARGLLAPSKVFVGITAGADVGFGNTLA